ncbi:membrane protease subunit HflC [Methylohalomonas lacus]|uniref:Protein HflC n=1 Tax=Methylohalomonas lacus TaxID=398773 RepID=A0AAE3L0F3_9GAMM|nr:protease modulator HflC [Methylohalomonas lacus]MCS3902394.1 membrane protease subunit HflC [Methylohalomonas lacus]
MTTWIQRLALPVIVLLIIVYFSAFKVDQWEKAIVFKFREIERTDLGPGLHFMIPMVNTVQKFDTRVLNLDQDPQRFLTSEKKDVIVDYYVKWRIENLDSFYTSTRGDMMRAELLLSQKINGALREEFADRTVQEVVASERGMVMNLVQDRLDTLTDDLGIDVLDVRTMRIDLPENVSASVYERMRAERERVAKDFRARGAEAAERIQANADREREVILARAYRDAEVVRGEGDAQAAEIYANAYNRDSEFYNFYRSLGVYREGFDGENSILLLKPDSELFRYFNTPQPQ